MEVRAGVNPQSYFNYTPECGKVKRKAAFDLNSKPLSLADVAAVFAAKQRFRKADGDARLKKYRAIEAEIWAAVKAGKLSEKDAKLKLEAARKEIWADKKTDRQTRR